MSLCRTSSTLRLAVVEAGLPHMAGGAPLAERARASVGRLHRPQPEIREALSVMVDAIVRLEQDLVNLRVQHLFREHGIEPSLHDVVIGGDGIRLHEGPWKDGASHTVVFSLPDVGGGQWFSLPCVVAHDDMGVELMFTDLSDDLRDTLVGFVFRTQAKERRRELDTLTRARS